MIPFMRVRTATCCALLLSACSADYGGRGAGGGYAGPPGEWNAGPQLGAAPDVAPPGTQPEPATSYWLQLSADDSTSMASAQIAKLGGVPAEGLHRHEFLNYYDPPPSLFAAEDWALAAAPAPGIALGVEAVAGAANELALFVQLAAAPVVTETRRPWNLVFCVDVSGSMEGEKMEFVRDALADSLGRLRTGDHVSLVTFSEVAKLVFDDLVWPNDEAKIRHHFAGLVAGGGTNMIAGLDVAYARAAAQRSPERLTRVLVFGDGDANVGDTSLAAFRAATRVGNEEGVYLSSVGVGFGFDWTRMDQLADAGKGASIFLPNAEEATRMFATEQFTKLVEIAADEVDVELELPVGLTLVDFSGEETSTDPNARVPSVVLAAGDDLSMLARFAYTDTDVLDEPITIRVRLRPLGTAAEVVFEHTFDSVASLLRDGGAAFERAAIVDAYARLTTGATDVDAASLVTRIDAFGALDAGLVEIRSLLAP